MRQRCTPVFSCRLSRPFVVRRVAMSSVVSSAATHCSASYRVSLRMSRVVLKERHLVFDIGRNRIPYIYMPACQLEYNENTRRLKTVNKDCR